MKKVEDVRRANVTNPPLQLPHKTELFPDLRLRFIPLEQSILDPNQYQKN